MATTVQVGTFQPKKSTVWLLRVLIFGALGAAVYFNPPWGRNWATWLSGAAWLVYSTYWMKAARNAAEAKSSESAKSRKVHEVLLNGGLFLLFLPVWGLRAGFRPEAAAWAPAGLALQGASIALAVWARRHLGSNWSGRIEIKVEHKLVRTGPYRLLRHPIYTAMLGMFAGTALIDGHVHALIGLGLAVLAYWRKVRMEEAKMREAFGTRYEAYRRGTLGAVPGIF